MLTFYASWIIQKTKKQRNQKNPQITVLTKPLMNSLDNDEFSENHFSVAYKTWYTRYTLLIKNINK